MSLIYSAFAFLMNLRLPAHIRGIIILFILFSVLHFPDDDDKPVCTPLLKQKPDKGKSEANLDLNTILSNIDRGQYDAVAQFDSDMNGLFSNIIREQGKANALGTAATHLKKVTICEIY